jgi:flagellin-like hook-associated protein FlgL
MVLSYWRVVVSLFAFITIKRTQSLQCSESCYIKAETGVVGPYSCQYLDDTYGQSLNTCDVNGIDLSTIGGECDCSGCTCFSEITDQGSGSNVTDFTSPSKEDVEEDGSSSGEDVDTPDVEENGASSDEVVNTPEDVEENGSSSGEAVDTPEDVEENGASSDEAVDTPPPIKVMEPSKESIISSNQISIIWQTSIECLSVDIYLYEVSDDNVFTYSGEPIIMGLDPTDSSIGSGLYY